MAKSDEPDACEPITCDNCGDDTTADKAVGWVFSFTDAGLEVTICPACEIQVGN